VGAAIIGGSNFVAVRFSNEEMDPMFGAAFRFALATILLLGIMALTGRRLPKGRAAAGAVIYGLLGIGLSYALLYYFDSRGIARVSDELLQGRLEAVEGLGRFLAA
jgi:drug/metabolite transporter (DMT)-like permease